MIFKNGVVIEQYFYVDRIMLEYYEIYPAECGFTIWFTNYDNTTTTLGWSEYPASFTNWYITLFKTSIKSGQYKYSFWKVVYTSLSKLAGDSNRPLDSKYIKKSITFTT